MAVYDRWEQYTTPRPIQAGETLFAEGDPAHEMFIIQSGQVMVTRNTPGGRPLVLGYRGAGEFIGEMALISDAPRTATVVAVRPTTLLAISRAAFWPLLRSDDSFRQMVMDTLISRLLTADESRVLPEVWERRLVAGFDTLTSDQERLEKILQLRRETLYFILHDLRNPLGLAITALAMIELEGDDPRTHNARQFLATAESGLSRVLLLVESLLDVERLDQGEARLDLEPADLVGLVERTVTLLQPMAATSRIDLRADLPAAGLPAIPLDRARLERVLVNLIDNALRFTPPGGVITVRARQEGDRLVVSVNDTGRGIPPQQRERVFDRFAQVEEVPTTGGFGMGLAYCRSAVAAHGGEIRAEEGDGGVGAKIVFWLPL